MDLATLTKHTRDFLPGHLGIRFLEAAPERVCASLEVEPRLCTMPGVLHGGAVMALADTLGAVGAVLNLEPGHGTTTIESKTNFFAAGREGEAVHGACTPLHRGRRTQVWQTRVTGPDDRLLALVTQGLLGLLERAVVPRGLRLKRDG